MANGDHRHITIEKGDTVVLSATAIPGNETAVYRNVDNLFRLGADVLYNRVANVHVRGHAAREELKIIQGLASAGVLRARFTANTATSSSTPSSPSRSACRRATHSS